MKNGIIVKLLIIVFSVLIYSQCLGANFKIEYDNNLSTTSGVTNLSTLYNIFNSNLNKSIENTRFKLFISFSSSLLTNAVGHEYFGHAYPCRLKNIDYHLTSIIPLKIYSDINNDFIKINKNIGGFSFENCMLKEFTKQQIINGADYISATMITMIRLGFYGTSLLTDDKNKFVDSTANDINTIERSWVRINTNTKLSSKDIKNCIRETSFFDPISIINYLIIAYTIKNNTYDDKWILSYPILSYNFNIYPTSITREIGLYFLYNKLYFQAGYEFGKDLNDKKIDGFNFDICGIKANALTIDLNFHYLKDSFIYIRPTFYYNNFYMRWKHYFNMDQAIESRNRFSLGYMFNF